MSDGTRTTGRLTFDPPLAWKDYRRFTADEHSMLLIEEHVEVEETDDGERRVRTAVAVVVRHEDPWGRHDDLERELGELVALARVAGSTLRGYLYGEYDSDVTRFWVDDDAVVCTQDAILVWPNGHAAHEWYQAEPIAPGYPGAWWRRYGVGPQVFADVARKLDTPR